MQAAHIKLGTRGSQLALWQAQMVADLLTQQGHTAELVIIETKGDKQLDVALHKIGSKGVFTEELEQALLDGRIHAAVHSAKDMQSKLQPSFELIAFSEREQVNDVVLSLDPFFKLETAPAGTVIGTSSTRRAATLARHFPHVQRTEMRGNLQTRLEKLKAGTCHAMLLAWAGVNRMGMQNYVVQHLPTHQFTPPAGQGSVAIEVEVNLPEHLKEALKRAVNHAATALAIQMERAFLATLQGGCSIPVFAWAGQQGWDLVLCAGIISLDGSFEIREEGSIPLTASVEEAQQMGVAVAQKCIDKGALQLLADIRKQQG